MINRYVVDLYIDTMMNKFLYRNCVLQTCNLIKKRPKARCRANILKETPNMGK